MMLVDKAEVKKYEFTGETKQVELLLRTVILHRIRAVTDFGMVKAGELGGWIEKEENLSQEGKAWISDEAEVYGNAKISDNAHVADNAKVYDEAKVQSYALVYGNAEISDNAFICSNVNVYGNAKVSGNAWIGDNAEISDNAKVGGYTKVHGNVKIYGNAKIWGNAVVCDNTNVYENARIYENVKVQENARICGEAEVYSENHILIIGPVGRKHFFITFFRDKDNEITVECANQSQKIDKFMEKVTLLHGNNKEGLIYRAAIEVARLQIDLRL